MAQTKGNHLSIQDTNNTAQRIHTHYLAVIFTRSREGGLKKNFTAVLVLAFHDIDYVVDRWYFPLDFHDLYKYSK